MQISELIRKLLDAKKVNPKAEVVLHGREGSFWKFSGVSCDDNGDVELYISASDERH